MTKPAAASQVARAGERPREAALRQSDGQGVAGVNPAGRSWARSCRSIAFTIALVAGLPAGSPAAQGTTDRFARPAPNVERQVDRLERGGGVDPLTRRRLEDQLRREPRGPERSAAERTLDRLPAEAPAPDPPLPAAPAPDSLPSSLRPGFGGGGGGPGTSGHMVPPGGRGGGVR